MLQSPAVNSITVDPHKLIGQYDLSLLYVRREIMEQGECLYLEGASKLRGTSKGAAIPAHVLQVMESKRIDGLHEIARERYYTARKFSRELQKRGLRLMSEITSGIVAIEMASLQEADLVRVGILQAGYNIPAPIVVKTNRGERYGIRFVFTNYESEDFLNVMVGFLADLLRFVRSYKDESVA